MQISRWKFRLWIIAFTAAIIYFGLSLRSTQQGQKRGELRVCQKSLGVQHQIIKLGLESNPPTEKLARLQKDYAVSDPTSCQALIHGPSGKKK